jgi:invasion protein IalB
MRRLLAAALMLAPLAAGAQMPSASLIDAAPALPEIRPHGDWRVTCAANACTAAPATQVPPLQITIARDTGGEVLVLRAPLGLLLGEGVEVTVDGRTLGRLAFLTCEADGCIAPIRLDGTVRSALRGGRDLTLTVTPRDGTALVARYSLIGFIAATGDLNPTLRPEATSGTE